MDFWVVAYKTGETIIVRGEDLYDVHTKLWSDDKNIAAVVHLSQETVKKYAIDTIADM